MSLDTLVSITFLSLVYLAVGIVSNMVFDYHKPERCLAYMLFWPLIFLFSGLFNFGRIFLELMKGETDD